MRRLSLAVCALVSLVASPLVSQEPPPDEPSFATLCMIDWSIGPIWAGASRGCAPVVQPLQAPNRPCRTRYSTSQGTAEEARLDYDAEGRLREVEHVGRGRAVYAYDAAGRLTTHTRHRPSYPPTSTTFTYAVGAREGDYTLSSDATHDAYGQRWHVEAGRIVSDELVHRDVLVSISRWLYEADVFVGVETTLCTTPSSSPSCEPSAPPSRSHVTRDRAGRIATWSNADIVQRYTYDARGRVTGIRTTSPRLRADMRIDYVCPSR